MKEEPTKLILPSTIEHVKVLPKEWYDPSEDEYWLSYLTDEERAKLKQRNEGLK